MPLSVRTAAGLGRAVCRTVRPVRSFPLRHTGGGQSCLNHTPLLHAAISQPLRHPQPHRSASTSPSSSQPSPPDVAHGLAPAPPAVLSEPSEARQRPSESSLPPPPPARPSVWVSFLTLLSLFPVLFAVDDAVVTVATVHGRSMQPTLNPHLPPSAPAPSPSPSQSQSPQSPAQSSPAGGLDAVLVWKLSSQSASSLPCGCVLVLRSPYQPGRSVIKRLVGREGDWLAVPPAPRRRAAAADDEAEQRLTGGLGHIEQVAKGRVWVEGENEQASAEDSREYGQMPAALIQGRAVAVVWPPSRVRWIANSLQHVGGEQRLRNRMMAW